MLLNQSSSAKKRCDKLEERLQNLDKIETICEAPPSVVSTSNANQGSSELPTLTTSAFRDRFRHCSESAAALVNRFPPFRNNNSNNNNNNNSGQMAAAKVIDLHEELFQYKSGEDEKHE